MALDLDSFLSQQPDAQYWHCWPLLPKRGKLFIGAEAKSFKSMLALNMAYELAEGLPVLGRFPVAKGLDDQPVPKRVLVIEQEIGQQRLQERLLRIHKARQGKHAGANLWVVSKDLGARLDTDEGLRIIRGHIEQAAPHVIIIDPLRKFHVMDEDSSTQMGALMRTLDRLIEDYDLAVMVVHHHGKAREDRPKTSPSNMRGSSVLYDEGDTYIIVTEPDWRRKKLRQLNFTLRSADDPRPLMLEFQPESNTFKGAASGTQAGRADAGGQD